MKITAENVVWTSFFVDFFDILANVGIALLTGSVVMYAELFQGVTDLVASGLLLIGLKRPKNELLLWSLLSALVVLLLGSTLSIYFGYERFKNPQEIRNISFAFFILVVNVLTNGYAFYLSIKRIIGKGSVLSIFKVFRDSTLVMTKNTFVLDLMGMCSAFVGVIALLLYTFFGDLRFDGIGAIGIGVTLFALSIVLIIDLKNMKTLGSQGEF